MAEAAVQGAGVALLPVCMFERDVQQERLIQPFPIDVTLGAYWLTRLKSRAETRAMHAFRDWLLAAPGAGHRTTYRPCSAVRSMRPATSRQIRTFASTVSTSRMPTSATSTSGFDSTNWISAPV